jgi:glycosyltransferase involved in cell wall biosynthesis
VIVVNGRFLRSRPSGMHRVGRELLDAARAQGMACQVLAPAGVTDPRVDRVTRGRAHKGADLLWEQTTLPWAARGRPVLSLANTAPLLSSRNAVLVHDLAPLHGPEWFGRSMKAYLGLVLAVARRAPLVLTVSATVADELVAVGVPRERLAVVRNAVGDAFRPAVPADVEAVLRRHGVEPPYLLMVGWADPRKDVDLAVRAHLAAAREVPHQLVVLGQQHTTFAPTATPTGPSVRFLGYVDEPDLAPLLTGAAALVYPTRYEGFGLPPLEAMACGTPALVSDLPVLRETAEGRAVYVGSGDEAAWARAMVAAVRGELPVPQPVARTWADAGRELREALARLT